jgi:AMIN domain
MSCKPYFGALLSVALLAEPLIAQTGATVEHVLVRGNADAMEVEIQTSGAIAPNTQAITGPDRIVVDFPGALPSAELRALTVNRGALKSVRSGLFFKDPPITRIVLDLDKAQPYRISSTQNAVVVKLGASAAEKQVASAPSLTGAQLRETALVSTPSGSAARPAMTNAVANLPLPTHSPSRSSNATAASGAAAPATVATLGLANAAVNVPMTPIPALGQGSGDVAAPVAMEPLKPPVSVSYENGMLSIHSYRATLSQVLFEVHLKTQAEVGIPAGAEREEVIVDLGPGPARDVLGALLNGSPYNFIFVGNELTLERVILTRRDTGSF